MKIQLLRIKVVMLCFCAGVCFASDANEPPAETAKQESKYQNLLGFDPFSSIPDQPAEPQLNLVRFQNLHNEVLLDSLCIPRDIC